MKEKKEFDFERALTRLEEIVEKIGDGGLTLDEAMKLFEEGAGLIKLARKRLSEVKGKLEVLKVELEESEEELSKEEVSEDVEKFISGLDEGEFIAEGEEDEDSVEDSSDEEDRDVDGLF
jgi:exodeoxyribonuclease VII small subunit